MKQLDSKLQEYFKGCLFPQVELEEWAETHDLSLDPAQCPFCESMLAPSIPFATREMRGIIYEQCQCPEYPKDQAPCLFAAADPLERQHDREFAQSLFDYM